jgi:hypothetical protein
MRSPRLEEGGGTVVMKAKEALRGALVLVLLAAGCGKKEEEAKYVRPSAGCTCAEKKDAPQCHCNHCMGEKLQGKPARCYCDTGGCGCGPTQTKCACDHCQGEDDGPTCSCKDKKK